MVDKTDTKMEPPYYQQELHPSEEFVTDGLLGRIKDGFNRCGCALNITFAPVYIDFFENFLPNKVRKAFDLATRIHADDSPRLDGRAYITHPYGVYRIVKRTGLGEEARVLALLHDTNESIKNLVYGGGNSNEERVIRYIERRLSERELRKTFGDDFGLELLEQIVAMTPPSKIHYNGNKEERDEFTFQAIAEVSDKYPVVMAVRLADRLYNMMDLKHFKERRQEELAHDTLRYAAWARSHIEELGSLTPKGEEGILRYLIAPNELISSRIIAGMEAKRKDKNLDAVILERRLQELQPLNGLTGFLP